MQTSNQFSCFIVGEGLLARQCAEAILALEQQLFGILTNDPVLRLWAQGRSLLTAPLSDAPPDLVKGHHFDFLFSIVNYQKLSPEWLQLPRRAAINFHNSLLPHHGGFNSSVWAILNGDAEHGVTWHSMVEDVDAGSILKQTKVRVLPGMTSYQLNSECHEAGLNAFRELIEDLPGLVLTQKNQLEGERSFHPRWQRPTPGCVVDWTWQAARIESMAHALDFGVSVNPLGLPKIRIGDLFLTASEIRATTRHSMAPPGTVVKLDEQVVVITASDFEVEFRQITTLEGEFVSVQQLQTTWGLQVGITLKGLGEEEARQLLKMEKCSTRREREWVTRLLELEPINLPHATRLGVPQPAQCSFIDIPAPAEFTQKSAEEGGDIFLSAVVAYLARVNSSRQFDIGWQNSSDALSLFTSQVPLRGEVDLNQTFSDLVSFTRASRQRIQGEGALARDVVMRYPELKHRAEFAHPLQLPVAVAIGGTEQDSAIGRQCTFQLMAGGSIARFHFEIALLSGEMASEVARQFKVMWDSATLQPYRLISELPLLDAEMENRILRTWNQTAVPLAVERTIHEAFESQARRTPTAVALVEGGREWSYQDLNTAADHVAARLKTAGVGRDNFVGICCERSLEMVAGLLGILKSGAAYLPLDPEYPEERLQFMIQDSQAMTLLADATHESLFSGIPGIRILRLDQPTVEGAPLRNGKGHSPNGSELSSLAYLIYTSGSTGKPKGVMVTHANVMNFFTGMDEKLGSEGEGKTWLAVTSISFDISVLELFWTLSRGFKVVLSEGLAALTESVPMEAIGSNKPVQFSLFYFASDATEADADRYALLLEGAKFADTHGFQAVWTPERHFHAFGGLYPNPAITAAALATITRRIALRAGSVVLPLHHPIRVAEEWSMIDNLSGGRVGLSFASGWHENDFVFAPENYARRRDALFEQMETVKKLWRGDSVSFPSSSGAPQEVRILPRPIQAELPVWVTASGNPETFRQAGEKGANLLTNLLGQSVEELAAKIQIYREAWNAAEHAGNGTVTVMLHTFVGESVAQVREMVRRPFSEYLRTSVDLIQKASSAWSFAPFAARSKNGHSYCQPAHPMDFKSLSPEDMEAMLNFAFERYFETSGLFGTPESCSKQVHQLQAAGVNEIACLIDFGVESTAVLESLPYLDQLRERFAQPQAEDFGFASQVRRHRVTHLQCTPSLMSGILDRPELIQSLKDLKTLLLGGEALPVALLDRLKTSLHAQIINMYGPTETTVWSTTARVDQAELTIGKPIANTQVYILDSLRRPVPPGVPGEVFIAGFGVARGYWKKPELTAERFLPNPFRKGLERMYRTGDFARFLPDGRIDFIGRVDHQVKIRGHRIEPGECEAILREHPLVREVVVVPNVDGGDGKLVAYVVSHHERSSLPNGTAKLNSEKNRVTEWEAIWDGAYTVQAASEDPIFHIGGWSSTFSGAPLAPAAMQEWVEKTIDRIRELKPQRVLELGCGSGLLLFRLARETEQYTGLDVSKEALQHIRQNLKRVGIPESKINLLHRPAHEVAEIDGTYDCIILNSVIQYFPTLDYLKKVIQGASKLLQPGGKIFIGDVRSFPLLPVFNFAVESNRSIESTPCAKLRERMEEASRSERELLVDPHFFESFCESIATVRSAHFLLKRGMDANEMVRFRYDVILDTGDGSENIGIPPRRVDWEQDRLTVSQVQFQLSEIQPAIFEVQDVPNGRVWREARLTERCGLADGALTLGQLNMSVPHGHAIDPEEFAAVGEEQGYRVVLRLACSGKPDCFDAVFMHARATAIPGPRPFKPSTASLRLANTPLQSALPDHLRGELRQRLRSKLPGFMVPSEIVFLEALPRTPNGKLDRNALPAPDSAHPASRFVAPMGVVEEIIADIWSDLLGIGRISRSDNFFEIGGHSLLATQLVSRLRETFRVDFPLRKLFEAPVVSRLAEVMELIEGSRTRLENIAAATKRLRELPLEGNKFLHQSRNVSMEGVRS